MSSSERTSVRTLLARDGFSELGDADRLLTELADLVGIAREDLLVGADRAADPDAALESLVRVARRDPAAVGSALRRVGATLWLLLGASSGFGDFYLRHPAELAHVRAGEALPTADE
ncbi:MAG: bifunctional glutamine-synthetase adenylyltransferase/deadenyltransferase, partial [Microbacterium hominis]|nr:bifunctional glutamine-synthetase adenylyltransferase/deadenyltransferase [Microbacterium hominis]